MGWIILGTVKLRAHNYVDERACLYLNRFAVQPGYQGAGLGLYLLHFAERLARREGFKCMQLDTAQPAEHLVKFYAGQGFEIRRPIFVS